MILFVGDKPSRLNKDSKVAFKGAACEPRLREWIEIVGNAFHEIVNSTDEDCILLARLTSILGYPVIALGNNASNYLKRNKIEHFKLPHPSGRNRQINDKKFISTKLSLCKEYIGSKICSK